MTDNFSVSLIDRMVAEPTDFEFMQAVRLIELLEGYLRHGRSDRPFRVGGSAQPTEERVRFHANPDLCFPVAELEKVDSPATASKPITLTVNFMGLIGPTGVLPRFYTEQILESLHSQEAASLDFFNLFNHRLISLFYRAATKYRLPIAFERSWSGDQDLLSVALDSLVGLGTEHLKGRLPLSDQVPIYYGGHFARQPRSATVLEQILTEFFGQSVAVIPFRGRWLRIARREQTRLPGGPVPDGQYHRLDDSAILGERTWEMQGGFLIRLGPLRYQEFCLFMPDGPSFEKLAEFTRLFVGPGLDFEIQVAVAQRQIPPLRLGGPLLEGGQPRLGWNTWLRGNNDLGERSDAVFMGEVVRSQ